MLGDKRKQHFNIKETVLLDMYSEKTQFYQIFREATEFHIIYLCYTADYKRAEKGRIKLFLV